jgi:hypothetical protein
MCEHKMPSTSTIQQQSSSSTPKYDDIKPDISNVKKSRRTQSPQHRRTPKDANAPKKPASSYVLFCADKRASIAAERKDASMIEIAKLVGEKWRNLSDAERQPYIDSATKLKHTYDTKMADYKKSDEYKEWVKKTQRDKLLAKKGEKVEEDVARRTKRGDINIFSDEFLSHNKARETKLRQLRTRINEVADEQSGLRRRLTHLRQIECEQNAELNQLVICKRDCELFMKRAVNKLQACQHLPTQLKSLSPDKFITSLSTHAKISPTKSKAIRQFITKIKKFDE